MTHQELLKRVGINMQRIRRRNGVTVRTISEKTLLGMTAINNVLRGKTLPHATSLVCICEVIGCDPYELFIPLEEEKKGL